MGILEFYKLRKIFARFMTERNIELWQRDIAVR